MTTPSQLGTVRTEIGDLKAKILQSEEALAATQSTTETDFHHKQLEQLDRQLSSLREQETNLLRRQVSGEQCLPCYLCHHLTELVKLHAHLLHVMVPSRPQTTRECCQPST